MSEKPLLELPTAKGSEFVNPEDIISIHANDKNIFVHIENQEKILVKLSIGRAEKLFDHPWFVKCHRSHIINILKIKEYLYKESLIKLVNGDKVPISESYLDDFNKVKGIYCKCPI